MHFSMIHANPLTYNEMFIRVGLAILIGCIVGVEREYKNRPAGLRTHVLVCLGACMIAMIESLFVLNVDPTDETITYSFGRLCAQVISGIGFLGAGTIFTSHKKIAGLTTAASLWNTACLGIATGYGYYLLSLFGCFMVLLVLLLLQKLIRVNAVKRVEIRFIKRSETLPFINDYFEENNIKVLDMDFHFEAITNTTRGEMNTYTISYTLNLPHKVSYTDVVNHLSSFLNILLVRTTNT